jgi:hypothetical protein
MTVATDPDPIEAALKLIRISTTMTRRSRCRAAPGSADRSRRRGDPW